MIGSRTKETKGNKVVVKAHNSTHILFEEQRQMLRTTTRTTTTSSAGACDDNANGFSEESDYSLRHEQELLMLRI